VVVNGKSTSERVIDVAIGSGRLELVKLLVKAGAHLERTGKYRYVIDKDDPDGGYSEHVFEVLGLSKAILGNHTDVAIFLLEQGANPNELIQNKGTEISLMTQAALNGTIQLVAALVNHGAYCDRAIRSAESHYRYQARDSRASDIELREKNRETYCGCIKILLDHAVGSNVSSLDFLTDLDVTFFNFIGLSFNGQPITKELLQSKNVQGAEGALVSLQDLSKIEHTARYSQLRSRIESIIEKRGHLESGGILNLVPLPCAVAAGDVEAVKIRLLKGANPNEVYRDCWSLKEIIPIVCAAEQGFTSICNLLAAHPDIDKDHRMQALKMAQRHGYLEIVDFLESFIDINKVDSRGNTRLHHAVEAGNLSKVADLIAKGAKVTKRNKDGITALRLAAISATEQTTPGVYCDIISLLLRSPHSVTELIETLNRTIRAGAYSGLSVIRLLIDKILEQQDSIKVYENQTSHLWYSEPVYYAIRSKHAIEQLAILKEYGATFNSTSPFDKHQSLLSEAIYSLLSSIYRGIVEDPRFANKLDVIEFLLKNGAKPGIQYGHGRTELHILSDNHNLRCSENAYQRIADLLIKYGIYVNAIDKEGNTALHLAARDNNLTAIRYLLGHGADIDLRNKLGNIPLHLAAITDNPTAIRYLVEHGADINCQNNFGNSPLYEAIANKSLDAVLLLINLGADVLISHDPSLPTLQVFLEQVKLELFYNRNKNDKTSSQFSQIWEVLSRLKASSLPTHSARLSGFSIFNNKPDSELMPQEASSSCDSGKMSALNLD
ncbi:ankyrin repeat domain-containing protein, partial [Legionella bononiensis]